ncbi:proteasome ATPase [Dietzia cinnamea]|uniref:proteasome ATPase n=2 Tax=Dietzia cinnamea TaxID=321318 RepID=UPI0021AE4EBA|nr:proteasome ATPase [Dietzia cinnamea]MCT2235025.1 proteasome ATPase [Dietzia cinnamea]MCT2274777.1 proteasome ATPase [Dietzia cinnamea]MCT2299626.1 proteasome ATPase [Dietzia cinnamea]
MTEGRSPAGQGEDRVAVDRAELARLRKAVDEGARSDREKSIKIDALGARNVRLAELLRDSRDQLEALKGEVERLGTPPSTYGVVLTRPAGPDTVEVMAAGRRMRLAIAPGVDAADLTPGVTVRLNEAMTVLEVSSELPVTGVTAVLRDVLADGVRARVVMGNDEEHIVVLAAALRGARTAEHPAPVRPGDAVLVDPKAGVAYEVVPKAEVDELLLEEIPTVEYSDIGGLGPQIEQIRDAIELPFVHHDLYREFHLAPPKGVLLYGPPGCGKTLIAKAVAHSLARAAAVARGDDVSDGRYPNSYFLSIKGPELLNKYVGETERHIRSIFERAREKATEGNPVIVFFDEMDSIFRTRGSGVSSDMETTIVPQLLAEIDGVEDLRNVIVIGASNREDMIDPAILRPGRLDLKIRIDRPDREAAADILAKYITPDLRFDPVEGGDADLETHVRELIERIVDRLYTRDASTTYVHLVYASGRRSSLYLADLTSGAMLRNIVDRAKKLAIKDIVHGTGRGLTTDDFLDAVDAEFAENTDLPNTSNPQEWARLTGVRGERVIEVSVPNRGAGQ